MQEGILSPNESLDCTPDFLYYQQVFHNWDPYVAPADGADAGARRVVRHLLLPRRRAVLQPLGQPRADAPALGAAVRVRRPDRRSTSAPRTPGSSRRRTGGRRRSRREIDRIWKPGYEVQLAIGQGDLEVTPIQMARFYAMIANGGQMVTPHIAQDVEQTGERHVVAAGAARARDPAGDAERRRPDVPPGGARGPLRGHPLRLRHLLRRLRAVPGPDRGQDGHGREGRDSFPAIRTR